MRLQKVLAGVVVAALAFGAAPVGYVHAADDVPIDATHFPNTNFRTYVSETYDLNKDHILSATESAGITVIDVFMKEMNDLTGIEYFPGLEELYCGGNDLTALDISKNTAITYINCSGNQISALDVSNNPLLKELSCGGNKISSLDVTGADEMEYLYCDNNVLTSLNVSGAPRLKEMYCDRNELTSLDLSKNAILLQMTCDNNKLTSLILNGAAELKQLSCRNNQLTELDVSGNPKLWILTASGNQIKQIDVSGIEDLDNLMYEDPDGEFGVTLDKEQKLLLFDNEVKIDRTIRVGKKTTIKVKTKIAGFGLTNASIVDVKVKGKKKKLVIKGIAPGVTKLFADDKKGNVIGEWTIKVE